LLGRTRRQSQHAESGPFCFSKVAGRVWLSFNVRHIRSICCEGAGKVAGARSVNEDRFWFAQSVLDDVDVAVDGLKGAGFLEANSRGANQKYASRGTRFMAAIYK
jgi:hypothetical protein